LAVLSAELRQHRVARLDAGKEVGEVALDMREVHLVEQQQVRRLRFCGGAQHEFERTGNSPDLDVRR